jgi:hypothetical protein
MVRRANTKREVDREALVHRHARKQAPFVIHRIFVIPISRL